MGVHHEQYRGAPVRCTRESIEVYLGYVCDSNVDCEDGYDENPELCAAGTARLTSFHYSNNTDH